MPQPTRDEDNLSSGREAIDLNGRPHVEKPQEPNRIHPDDQPVARRQDDKPSDDKKSSDSEDSQAKDSDKKKDDSPAADKKEAGKPDEKEDKKAPPKPPLYRRPVFWIAMVVLLAIVIVGLISWLHSRHYESTDDAFIDGHVVQISPQVSARVQAVYVDDNTHVRQGDPLFDLDTTDYQVAVDQARGNEDASGGQLEQAKAQVASSKAALDEANASLDAANISYYNADKDLKRYESLDDRARSQQQLDNAVTAQKNALAQVEQAKAKVASAQSQIAVADATVTSAQGNYETAVANRKKAEVNLGYCYIKAPTSGRVTTKNVEPGMYATMASPVMAIVQDDVWVVANYKETQLTDMKLGQPVSIEVDAYPNHEFRGHIDSIQMGTGARFSVLPAENATGNYVKVVQRVPVKIRFDESPALDNDRVLSPGMSVSPYVLVR